MTSREKSLEDALIRAHLTAAARDAGAPTELHAQIAADRARQFWTVDDYARVVPTPHSPWRDVSEHVAVVVGGLPRQILRDAPTEPTTSTPAATPATPTTPTARQPWELHVRDARNLKLYERAKAAAAEHGRDVVIVTD